MSSEPISLYLDLEPGQRPDLEVVARAALAFSAAIKEAVYVFDPNAQVRVELRSGTEGSLSLNSIIRLAKDSVDRDTLRIAGTLLFLWFVKEAGAWTVGKLMDYITGQNADPNIVITEQQAEDIAKKVLAALEKNVARIKVSEIYLELNRDTAVTGAGISSKPDKRPDEIVPRQYFDERSRGIEITIGETTRRTQVERARVTVIKPVLQPGDRHWRFSLGKETFGAPVKDREFIERLLSGQLNIKMMANIELDVEIEKVEEKSENAWEIKERSIIKVLAIHPPGASQLLLFSPEK